MKLNDTNGLWG